MEERKLTGYPSIDKPWMKYYQNQPVDTPLPECKYIEYIWQRNKDRLECDAFDYLGRRITYGQLFKNIQKAACGLLALGIKQGDIVTVFGINTPETLYCIFALNLLGAVPCIEYVTESYNEAKTAIEKCHSRIVLVLDVLLEKFLHLADLPVVEHLIAVPLAKSFPIIKKALFGIKANTYHSD